MLIFNNININLFLLFLNYAKYENTAEVINLRKLLYFVQFEVIYNIKTTVLGPLHFILILLITFIYNFNINNEIVS